MVAKGYAQMYGIEYEETFTLVSKMATIRAIIVLVRIRAIIVEAPIKGCTSH